MRAETVNPSGYIRYCAEINGNDETARTFFGHILSENKLTTRQARQALAEKYRAKLENINIL